MKESKLESLLKMYVEKAGGKAYKWVSPGCRGVPDRMLIFPYGVVCFVELKAPTGALSGIQKARFAEIERLGRKVWVVSNVDELSQFFQDIGKEEISKELDCRYDL